jgi:hypothetical protein
MKNNEVRQIALQKKETDSAIKAKVDALPPQKKQVVARGALHLQVEFSRFFFF